MNDQKNTMDAALARNTLDQIPTPSSDAKRITGLVKSSGRVTGYQLSDNSILSKEECIELAKRGGIMGVGVSHRGNTEYLKSIPDGSENNNLSSLPSIH
ncbi:DUF3892 domain-containing protein [Aminipila luticellarii]|uniref:DUF3892 domain-containing protein n=1 Tax=Aminipila luticellarii TaxID=2507160 RepID=A0A410PTN0_9FIRM|nr:DUF3892 domain-containing protein [Aminipila luticellarii]QAT42246.1 DUF3892 domain-containing protein [Aminipila luticellarii]